jgi:hypothetical protein
MKINFDQVLNQLDGKPFMDEAVPFTLKTASVRALTMVLQEDAAMSGEDAFKRLELARKVNAGGEVEIDPGDAVTIRNRAAKMYAVTISGQMYEMLK